MYSRKRPGKRASASFFVAKAARAQPLQLLFRPRPGHHKAVQILLVAGFHQQRSFDKCHVARAVARPLVQLLKDGCFHARVNDGVQPIELLAIGEHDSGQLGAVDAATFVKDGWSELPDDFVVCGLAGLDQCVGERVGIENGEAHFAEYCGDGAFAAGDAAGKTESKHGGFTARQQRTEGRARRLYRVEGVQPSRCCSSA